MDNGARRAQTPVMSEDLGLAWKLSFGTMVLAFCAITMVLRTPPVVTPVAPPTAAAIRPLPLLETPMAEVGKTSPVLHSAPADAVEDVPVRIEVSLLDPAPMHSLAKPPAAPRPAIRHGVPVARNKPAAAHSKTMRHGKPMVAAKAAASRKARRPHYPYDPREPVRWGDQQFALGR